MYLLEEGALSPLRTPGKDRHTLLGMKPVEVTRVNRSCLFKDGDRSELLMRCISDLIQAVTLPVQMPVLPGAQSKRGTDTIF